jgi:hypothetical protein
MPCIRHSRTLYQNGVLPPAASAGQAVVLLRTMCAGFGAGSNELSRVGVAKSAVLELSTKYWYGQKAGSMICRQGMAATRSYTTRQLGMHASTQTRASSAAEPAHRSFDRLERGGAGPMDLFLPDELLTITAFPYSAESPYTA